MARQLQVVQVARQLQVVQLQEVQTQVAQPQVARQPHTVHGGTDLAGGADRHKRGRAVSVAVLT